VCGLKTGRRSARSHRHGCRVRPNIELAKASGIATNRAIIVSDYMETNVPNVYAVGECAEHNGTVYGLVKPLFEQGKVLARHICGLECAGYQGSVQSAALKISGIDVFFRRENHRGRLDNGY
jgi:nitrite reductase (NADH) large subunit